MKVYIYLLSAIFVALMVMVKCEDADAENPLPLPGPLWFCKMGMKLDRCYKTYECEQKYKQKCKMWKKNAVPKCVNDAGGDNINGHYKHHCQCCILGETI